MDKKEYNKYLNKLRLLTYIFFIFMTINQIVTYHNLQWQLYYKILNRDKLRRFMFLGSARSSGQRVLRGEREIINNLERHEQMTLEELNTHCQWEKLQLKELGGIQPTLFSS